VTRGRTLTDRMFDPALTANAAAVLAFLYLPMVVLLVFSFSASKYASVWGGFTTRWYGDLVNDRALLTALGNSLVIGFAVATLSTVLGTTTALALERRAGSRLAAAGDAAVTLPIAMPDVVQGIALLMSFQLCWFALADALLGAHPSLGRVTVIVAHTAYAFAYVTVVVRARLAG
jgi:putrescine transport system permease protein